jgi:Holliday junction resolvasome RuvABC endonuclease subunit
MSTLALDLGTKLGWAIHFGPDDILHGTEEFKAGRFEGGGMRWLRFRKWLDEIADGHGPVEAVYFEEVRRHLGVDAAHLYGGFLSQLTAWCEKRAIPYQGIPVGTIKKSATGRGNANKEAMLEAVRALGFQPDDDNDADAIALLLFVTNQKAAA